jgi:hypothetical protein
MLRYTYSKYLVKTFRDMRTNIYSTPTVQFTRERKFVPFDKTYHHAGYLYALLCQGYIDLRLELHIKYLYFNLCLLYPFLYQY